MHFMDNTSLNNGGPVMPVLLPHLTAIAARP
jgi:hypothetical protein